MKKCQYCFNRLTGEEEGTPHIKNGGYICDNCWSEYHQRVCPLCGEYYDEPESASDEFFFLSPDIATRFRTEPGLYRGAEYPIFTADTFGDNVRVVEGHSILMCVTMIESKNSDGDFICRDCYNFFYENR